MTKEEIKLRVVSYVSELIDNVFPTDSLFGKMKNATAKLWVQQNEWRVDDILEPFMDKDGCIDHHMVIENYEKVLFENGEFRLDTQEIIPESMGTLRSVMPAKIVVFKKEDLYQLFGEKCPE